MTLILKRAALVAALLAAGTTAAVAGSIATSMAVGGSSASLASSAGAETVESSTNSSKKAVAQANGAYRVAAVAPAADRPGMVRMTLQPLAQGETVTLFVPQQIVDREGVAAGKVVNASQRAYGVEFARAETGKAFFLVVADETHRELSSKPVTL